jgi:hypothetical protein
VHRIVGLSLYAGVDAIYRVNPKALTGRGFNVAVFRQGKVP